jgi:hypothetical protein
MCLRAFFLLAPIVMWAASTDRPHLFLSFPALQQLDSLSASRIKDLDDARAYVRNAAAAFGVTEPDLLPEDLESRLAKAELDAAKDPSKLVSDDQVADAFNFLSDEFRVANPQRLTGADILLYRGVKASMFPHLYSPKTINGSRPVGALVMLDTLVCEGGVMEGIRKAAVLDRPPGSMKATGAQIAGHSGAGNSTPVQKKYREASLAYFARQGVPLIYRLARTLFPLGRT